MFALSAILISRSLIENFIFILLDAIKEAVYVRCSSVVPKIIIPVRKLEKHDDRVVKLLLCDRRLHCITLHA